MSFAEEKAAIERAAATMYYRHEYFAATMLIYERVCPDWRDLTWRQRVRLIFVIERARQAGISLRRYVDTAIRHQQGKRS